MNHDQQPPQTLHALLQRLGLQLTCYDFGRRIQQLPDAVWQSFEDLQRPYPQPYLRHACLAMVIQDGTVEMQSNPMLWFIRLPLDEFSMLDVGSRDLFIGAILHRLGRQMEQLQQNGESVDLLADNPFVFTPPEERLCQLHAILRADLCLPPSAHQAAALDYLQHSLGANEGDNWQHLELAGLADIAARLQEHHSLLEQSLPQLPLPVLAALCQGFENRTIDSQLSKLIEQRLKDYLQQTGDDAPLLPSLLRGLSQSTDLAQLRQLVIELLQSPHGQQLELLATLSSRFHLLLVDKLVCSLFLEQLAASPSASHAFSQLVAELLSLNTLKPTLIHCLLTEQRSPALASAADAFIAQATNNN
ncbi:uncharacterized protein DUF3549 [Sinobacterium caligoides]|uniref:Uncharacterized protein DUF3549 n=1 Tax=Sinobacterium caligoides TaxID=933926 RepID=A0A3N2D5A9_9GAMM|nr:DUF3549 family protein [Sinobacterium caligoides]ROR94862.1 uncharacterized protein DUF3549 [Sinobacterium caligoides]